MNAVTRAQLLSRSIKGGVALAVGGATVATLVGSASAANGPIADLDLALARLTVGAELVGIEFYNQAIRSKQFKGSELRYLNRALFNEQEHLGAMSGILTGAGLTAATADDFTIGFPDGTFASRESIAKFGVTLESVFTGTYLGAVDAFAASDLKTAAARIAACESQHLSVFSDITSNRPVGISFPAPLDEATVSAALDPYLQTAG